MKPRVIAAIFARGGSKGVPGKNVRALAGKPLIAHAIEVAKRSRYVDRVIVSTDDAVIAEAAAAWGADVPFIRPADLARDDSPEWLAWQHALRALADEADRDGQPRCDVMVCVPTTAPLRSVEDVDACIRLLLESDADVVITVTPASRSPYFNMVTMDADGVATVVIPRTVATFRRQDAPAVYDMTTVAYAARAAFVLGASSLFEGRVRAVVVPQERALDIDTELDFRVAECLFGHGGAR
jgi:CMP-N-acetylneuraminic acid synthetase